MACLASKEALVDAAKSAATSAKSSYDGAVNDARSLVPSSYPSRADFQAAKNAKLNSAKGALSGYISAVEGIKSAALSINPLTAVNLDALNVLEELANNGILGLIPGGPGSLSAISIAKLAKDTLQC